MVSKKGHSVLAFVPHNKYEDLRRATDAYALEVAFGRPPDVALNCATAVYVERQPGIQAWDARTLVRAAINDDL